MEKRSDRQSLEIGLCLDYPPQSWKPAGAPDDTLAEMNKSGGSIYEVIAPFIPAPLIDKAVSLGFDHWINKVESELFKVYFLKKN